mgnify:CR=1 FL=1
MYTCPRCEIRYCSSICYKSEAHSECSESFYKQCVIDEIKSHGKDTEGRKKMLEILKRVHEEDKKNMEALTSDDEIDNDELEELDSDDDNDVS